ncbi:MAG: hypothetical protein N3E51_01610 [Candidatus Micrarchaeota archaeon]|nr:hypothetical protein [Candidatus Micrarchaeota archaeon]
MEKLVKPQNMQAGVEIRRNPGIFMRMKKYGLGKIATLVACGAIAVSVATGNTSKAGWKWTDKLPVVLDTSRNGPNGRGFNCKKPFRFELMITGGNVNILFAVRKTTYDHGTKTKYEYGNIYINTKELDVRDWHMTDTIVEDPQNGWMHYITGECWKGILRVSDPVITYSGSTGTYEVKYDRVVLPQEPKGNSMYYPFIRLFDRNGHSVHLTTKGLLYLEPDGTYRFLDLTRFGIDEVRDATFSKKSDDRYVIEMKNVKKAVEILMKNGIFDEINVIEN